MTKLKLLVKPTHRCNFDCVYCYDKQFQVQEDMTLAMVEHIAKLAARTKKPILWTWHGGEPLLMPIEFYTAANEILLKYGITDVAMQSNGSLLTEDWILRLKEWSWHYCISFDGMANDLTRGHTEEVLNAVAMCKHFKYYPSIIRVVTPENVTSLSRDYTFFKSLTTAFSMNRVFRTTAAAPLDDVAIAIYLEEYVRMLDEWINDPQPIVVRNFDEYLEFFLGTGNYICTYTGVCLGSFLSINPVGDMYPCDCWYPPEFCYGNICDYTTLEDIQTSNVFMRLQEIVAIRKESCKDCLIYAFCNGGCNAAAVNISGGAHPEPLECKVRVKEFIHFLNTIKNLQIEVIPNPNLRKILCSAGYRSLPFLGEVLHEGYHAYCEANTCLQS